MPFWDQISPRGPRWTQEGHEELPSTQSLNLQKPLETRVFPWLPGAKAVQDSFLMKSPRPENLITNYVFEGSCNISWLQKIKTTREMRSLLDQP